MELSALKFYTFAAVHSWNIEETSKTAFNSREFISKLIIMEKNVI